LPEFLTFFEEALEDPFVEESSKHFINIILYNISETLLFKPPELTEKQWRILNYFQLSFMDDISWYNKTVFSSLYNTIVIGFLYGGIRSFIKFRKKEKGFSLLKTIFKTSVTSAMGSMGLVLLYSYGIIKSKEIKDFLWNDPYAKIWAGTIFRFFMTASIFYILKKGNFCIVPTFFPIYSIYKTPYSII
jgi:hypothetical protein